MRIIITEAHQEPFGHGPIRPCEREICANHKEVKLLVFPYVKGGEAFVPTGSFVGPVDVEQFK